MEPASSLSHSQDPITCPYLRVPLTQARSIQSMLPILIFEDAL